MKKANAIVGLLATVVFLTHAMTMSYSFMTGWYNFAICKGLAYATMIIVSVHILLSVINIFFLHDQTYISKYKKRNVKTIIQRATAIIIVILLHAHVKTYTFIPAKEMLSIAMKARIIIVELIYFASIYTHVSISFSKSLISLGLIRSDKAEKNINNTAVVVCIILFVVSMVSLVKFVGSWG